MNTEVKVKSGKPKVSKTPKGKTDTDGMHLPKSGKKAKGDVHVDTKIVIEKE
jgi:hypothetical protein